MGAQSGLHFALDVETKTRLQLFTGDREYQRNILNAQNGCYIPDAQSAGKGR